MGGLDELQVLVGSVSAVFDLLEFVLLMLPTLAKNFAMSLCHF